jgi:hypothetical protein
LDSFEPGSFEGMVLDEPYVDVLRRIWPGHAIAIIREDRTLGLGGATIVGTCAYPWIALSDEMRREFPVLITRLARQAMSHLFEVDGVDCIVVAVHPEFVRSRLWLQRLGFQTIDHSRTRPIFMGAQGFLLAAQIGMQVMQQAQQSRAQSKAARYEAEIARQQATYERSLADADAARVRRDSNALLGRQMARFAAAGMDVGSGSALLAQQSLAAEAEMEALRIRNGGTIRASALERSADLTLRRARDSARQGFASLAPGLLANMSSMGGSMNMGGTQDLMALNTRTATV